MLSKRLDDEASARKSQIEVTSAGKTINERRSELGLPLLDTPQADMPILVAGAGMYLFSPDGIINAESLTSANTISQDGVTETDQQGGVPDKETPEAEPSPAQEEEIQAEIDAETANEVKAFMKWANKGKRARLFEFKTLDPIVGDALNRCAFDGDLDTAKALAKAYLT
jgi:hypothetical protein